MKNPKAKVMKNKLSEKVREVLTEWEKHEEYIIQETLAEELGDVYVYAEKVGEQLSLYLFYDMKTMLSDNDLQFLAHLQTTRRVFTFFSQYLFHFEGVSYYYLPGPGEFMSIDNGAKSVYYIVYPIDEPGEFMSIDNGEVSFSDEIKAPQPFKVFLQPIAEQEPSKLIDAFKKIKYIEEEEGRYLIVPQEEWDKEPDWDVYEIEEELGSKRMGNARYSYYICRNLFERGVEIVEKKETDYQGDPEYTCQIVTENIKELIRSLFPFENIKELIHSLFPFL